MKPSLDKMVQLTLMKAISENSSYYECGDANIIHAIHAIHRRYINLYDKIMFARKRGDAKAVNSIMNSIENDRSMQLMFQYCLPMSLVCGDDLSH